MKESGLEGYEYFAYISYCDEDAAFAKKLQRHLEKYKLPVLLSRQYPRTPRKLTPVFRDDLPQSGALARTKFLIPICTETSARVDEWGGSRVDAEVHDFVTVNPSVNRSRVIPIIYRKKDGARATACIPAAVKALDLLALDVLDKGYEQVCNQLVSRMVGIKPGILWNRWLRKTRKNMAILAAISFTVLMAALVAIGGGLGLSLLTATLTVLIGVLCAHWYTTPRIVLFEHFIEANNLPVGIRKLSAKQALCRAYHYRFTYRGFRLVKVECCNSSGVPLPQQRPGFTHDEVACMELFYNEKGAVNKQVWCDERGVPLREILFEQQDGQDWVNFRSPGGDFADSHLLTKKDGLNSPVTRYQVQRNTQGHITKVHYCNSTGAFCADCDGTWGRRYAINTVLGVVTERTYLDEKGAAMPNREGVAGRTYGYDSAGRMIAFTNVNAQGEAMFDHALVATMRCELDAHGNRIRVSYHAPNGQRELCHQLMAEKRTTYDTRGFITAEAYFDKDGMPTINRDGFSRCVYTRNAAGSMTEVRYFDASGGPCLGAGLIHHEIRTLDAYGNCSTATYFNQEDKPCRNADSVHRFVQQYDEDGHVRVCHFFNEQGLPTRQRHGYHGVRYTYDSQGNIITESYYGLDDRPDRSKDGIAFITRAYDPHHNCIREAYFDTKGHPCPHAITYIAAIEREYDVCNNKIKESYFDVNQKQCLNQEGHGTIIWEYDTRGIAIIIRYYDQYNTKGIKREILREELITNQHGRYIKKSTFIKRPQPVCEEKWQFNDLGLAVIHSLSTDNKRGQGFKQHLQTHYKYDNRHRIIKKTNTNIEGTLIIDTHGVSEYRYTYDVKGNKTAESYYGPTGTPILHAEGYAQVKMVYDSQNHLTDYYYYDEKGQPCICSDGYASKHYLYDASGNHIQIFYRDTKGNPATINGYAFCCYQYNYLGKITKGTYFDEHNQPVLNQRTGISCFTCEYDDAGKKIRECFYDTDEQPCLCKNLNVAIIEWTYTGSGQVNMLIFRNTQSKLCECAYGYALQINILASNGSIKEELYYNQDYTLLYKIKPTISGANIRTSQIRNEGHLYQGHTLSLDQTSYLPQWVGREHHLIHYNKSGNAVEESTYGTNGQLYTPMFSSFAKKTYTYNADDKLIEESFFNTEGKLCMGEQGKYAKKTYCYNTDGQLTEEAFFDSNGRLYSRNNEQYAKKLYTYNSEGKLADESFYDEEGNLYLDEIEGYARKVYTYSSDGKITDETFYDKEGNLYLNQSEQYAKKIYFYNANGKLTEEAFLNTEGKLCLSYDMYARKIYSYDSNGKLTEEAFLNTEGKLCLNYDEYARKIYSYDSNGKLTEEAFYNIKGELCHNFDKYAKKIYTYNTEGNLEEEAYYNNQGQRCIHRALKYSRHCLNYDDNNRLICEFYLDTHDYPCIIIDDDGRISGHKGKRFTDILYNYVADEQGNTKIQVHYNLEHEVSHSKKNERVPNTASISHTNTDSSLQGQDNSTFNYFAFISYSSKDVTFANKLQRYIESFKLPIAISQRYPRSPRELKPIFRDRTDLEQGNLGDMLMRGLSSSKYLLVICSENSAKPNRFGKRYVDMEVNSFIALNPQVNKSRVIPIIYRESEHTPLKECIPPAISKHGLESIDLLKEGTARTLNRIAASMVEVEANTLWLHRQKAKRKSLILVASLTSLLFCGLLLGGIYATLIAILCAGILVLIGSSIAQKYWSTKTIRYARMMEEHNLPIGIRELSKQEASARERHYRFYYRGYRLRKVECCNAHGALVEQKRPGYSHDEVARLELFYDEKGAIVRQIWSDSRGFDIRDVQFEADDTHDIIRFRHANNLVPATHRKGDNGKSSSVTAYNITRNSAGHITEIRYCDHLSQACSDSDGTWGKRFIIDVEKSQITARYCLDDSGNIMRNNQGIAGRIYEYDEEGNMTSYTNVDEQGHPVYEQSGFAQMKCQYNTSGHCIEASYHKPDGSPVLNRNLVASRKTSYNEHGYAMEESYYNLRRELASNKFGYAQCRYQYDNKGRITALSYYDEQGRPCRSAEQYHREKRFLDEHGNIIQISYYDEEDKPCYVSGGIHQIIRKYNERGNLDSECYQDTQEKPCIHSKGYHMIQYEYDDYQNILLESYYDTKLTPCYNVENVAKAQWQYDSHNNCIQESYYATDNTPCINSRKGVSSCIKTFNSKHELINETYKGTKGLPVLNVEAVSSKKWEHDARIRKLCVSYSEPCNHHGVLYEKWLSNYYGQPLRLSQDFRPINSIHLMGHIYFTWQYDELGYPLVHIRQAHIKNTDTELSYFQKEHQIHYEYDEHRNIIRQWYSSGDGQTITNDNGIAEYRFEYDGYGRKIAESYYNVEGTPIITPWGYARLEMTYDKHGSICQYSYFNERGVRCTMVDGYSIIKLHYTPRGLLSSISYYNEQEQPVYIDGYTQIKFSYYPSGHMREYRFLNFLGKNVLSEGLRFAIHRYEYDFQGRKIRESYFDEKEQPCMQSILEASIIEWGYNDNGQIETLCFKNSQGAPCICNYGYAERITRYISSGCRGGHIEEEVYKDSLGRIRIKAHSFEYTPAFHIPNDISETHNLKKLTPPAHPDNLSPYRSNYQYEINIYNADEQIIETSFMNEKGDIFSSAHSAVAKTTYEYDKNGNLTAETNYNEKEELCMGSEEYAQKKCSYDSNGNQIKESFFNELGKLCQPRMIRYASKICTYNGANKLSEETYYDEEDKLCLNNWRYAQKKYSYDSNGNLIEEVFFDTTGKRCRPQKMGYSQKIYTYHENGRLASEAFFDENALPIMLPLRGFARRVLNYDSNQRLTLCTYHDANGKLCINKQGFAQLQYTYNQKGATTAIVYLNCDSQPCINRQGYAKEVSEYDQNGNCIEKTYLNTEDSPCINTHYKFSKAIYTYNGKGLCNQERYLDEKGHPCLYLGLFASRTYGYDEQGHKTREEFHGDDGALICIEDRNGKITGKKGCRCASISYHCETRGDGKEIQITRYYDEDGNEVE